MSYELMQNKDIRLELDFDRAQATAFLRLYGRWIGRLLYIPRKKFRQLQLDGTVAEFRRRLRSEARDGGHV